MPAQPRQAARNSPFVIDYKKALKSQRAIWTAKSLGIELGKQEPFTKTGFEHALKRVSRRAKK